MGELADVTATGFAAGLVGGGISDGAGGLWEHGATKADVAAGSRVPATPDEITDGSTSALEHKAPADDGTAPPATRKEATARRRAIEKTRSSIAGGAAAASIATTDLVTSEEKFDDPGVLLDPNVARFRSEIHEEFIRAGRDKLGK